MNRTLISIAIASIVSMGFASSLQAEPWTYRGSLNDAGKPANGAYDLRVTLLNEAKSVSVSQPITLYGVQVKDGQFAVDVDFGISLNNAPALNLKTEVQQAGSGFVALGEPTRFDAKAALAGVCWDTEGNAGTNPAINFIGTTDAQPLVLRTRNVQSLRIEPSSILFNAAPTTANVIAGSSANFANAGVRGATIAGGGNPLGDSDPDFPNENPNRVTDHYGSVGGGYANWAGNATGTVLDTPFATIGGGRQNWVQAEGGTIGGGLTNTVDGAQSTIGGGQNNEASAFASTIGGGNNNAALGNNATVAGGQQNQAGSAPNATVGGGTSNLASGERATVSGGANNSATAIASTVSGGDVNVASGARSTVAGGTNNCAGGDFSWAGGFGARVRPGNEAGDGTCTTSSGDADGDNGTFVWADDQGTFFGSTGPRQFLVRAGGGVAFNANFIGNTSDLVVGARAGVDANVDLLFRTSSGREVSMTARDSDGGLTLSHSALSAGAPRISAGGATLSNGGVWTNASSRALKTGFTPIDPLEVLRKVVTLPVSTWTYKSSTEGIHMGPMAEDFKSVFGLAGDGKAIGTVDADGVALAAIQGLNQKLESVENENAALRTLLASIEARLRAFEQAGGHP
jgi:hypothetical protein